MQNVSVLDIVLHSTTATQRTLCVNSVPCAGHGKLMTPSSSALDRQRLAQNADYARAVRSGAIDDSAHRLGGRMRGAEDGENQPPNTAKRSQPQKKRLEDSARHWSGQTKV